MCFATSASACVELPSRAAIFSSPIVMICWSVAVLCDVGWVSVLPLDWFLTRCSVCLALYFSSGAVCAESRVTSQSALHWHGHVVHAHVAAFLVNARVRVRLAVVIEVVSDVYGTGFRPGDGVIVKHVVRVTSVMQRTTRSPSQQLILHGNLVGLLLPGNLLACLPSGLEWPTISPGAKCCR